MKFTPEEIEEQRAILNTAEELPYESDGNFIGVPLIGGAFRIIATVHKEQNLAYLLTAANNYPGAMAEIEYWQTAMQRESNRVVELLNENSALKIEIERLREALQRIANSLEDYDDDLPAYGIASYALRGGE